MKIDARFMQVKKEDIIKINFSKSDNWVGLVVIGVIVVFSYFIFYNLSVPLVLTFAIFFVFRNSGHFSRKPYLIIDKNGITHRQDFFPWESISDTTIKIATGDGPELLELSFYSSTDKRAIRIEGLDKPRDEIARYIECFRTNKFD